jgi:hypothetical protein
VPLSTPTWVWGFDGVDPILESEQPDGRSSVRWDIETGALVPLPGHFGSVIAATSDRTVLVRFDEESQCTSAVLAERPDAALWERCDLAVQTLSPDGKLALGARFTDGSINQTADQLAVVDLKTGADIAALDVPPSGRELGHPRTSSFGWYVESWEPDGSVLVFLTYQGLPGEDPDSNFAPYLHTLARCSVTTGACELVPEPVERVSTRT